MVLRVYHIAFSVLFQPLFQLFDFLSKERQLYRRTRVHQIPCDVEAKAGGEGAESPRCDELYCILVSFFCCF